MGRIGGPGGAPIVTARSAQRGWTCVKGLYRVASVLAAVQLAAVALLFLCVAVFPTDSAAAESGRTVLIVAPHPDDDVLFAAGVAASAVARGDTVKVVYMTNGDVGGPSSGLTRQDEAVRAQTEHIGTSEDDLIFLGYPDSDLFWILQDYPESTDLFTTIFGQSTTYGERGLGRADYHLYRFGEHGNYNAFAVREDLASILAAFQPEDVYTSSAFDEHPDHFATYVFVRGAIVARMAEDDAYAPTLHTAIIHWGDNVSWPAPMDPRTDMVEPAGLLAGTGLRWSARESLAVPQAMQSTGSDVNPKYLAIDAHASQGGAADTFLARFMHRDEVFWIDDVTTPANHPPTAAAGPAQDVVEQSSVRLDDTGSADADGDSLTYAWTQTAGPTVTLSSASEARPSFTAPAAPASLAFELVVNDGQVASSPASVTITVLPAQGADVNIGALATITASTQSSGTGQVAANAVDGVVDGYPGDYTREWASSAEKAGAWLKLTWPSSYVVSRIVLYDRPNTDDQITAATLRFSDGTTLATGALPNNGTALTLDFSARSITSVELSIDAASSSTFNIGLAEIEVYGHAL